jgi:hypothetical protein
MEQPEDDERAENAEDAEVAYIQNVLFGERRGGSGRARPQT